MTDSPLESAQRCPLCGAANQCGMAAGAATCWCFSVSIAPAVLEKIPESARGRTCICRACAARAAAADAPERGSKTE